MKIVNFKISFYSLLFALVVLVGVTTNKNIEAAEAANNGVGDISLLDVEDFAQTVGVPTITSITEQLENIFGNIDGSQSIASSSLNAGLSVLKKDLIELIGGALVTGGVVDLLGKTFNQAVELSVDEAVDALIGRTLTSSLKNLNVMKFSTGLVVGFIQDVAKDVVADVVYSTTKNRFVAGVAVVLVEQALIYTTSGGSLYKILADEAALVASRAFDLGGLYFEIDDLYDGVAKNDLHFALLDKQVKYTQDFSKSDDLTPSPALLSRINDEVDDLSHEYSRVNNRDEIVDDFKSRINNILILHKYSYRYDYLAKTRKQSEELYLNYLNNYFSDKEQPYYLIMARIGVGYSDVEKYTDLHNELYMLQRFYQLEYLTSGLPDRTELSPNEKVGNREFSNWLDIIAAKLTETDGVSYTSDSYTSVVGYADNFLNRITFAQIADAFYQELYGENYHKCFVDAETIESNRVALKRNSAQELFSERYTDPKDELSAKQSIINYYSAIGMNLAKNIRYELAPKPYLTNSNQVKRHKLISFGYKMLDEHAEKKQLIASCNVN